MNFSVVLASRQRSSLLSNLLASIEETTKNIDEVEVIVGIDDDDAESQDARVHLTRRHPFVKFLSRPRSTMLNRDYLNWGYDQAGTGRFVIVCNDDAAFRTVGWDEIILAKLEAYLADKPDEIVYGFIDDALNNRHGMAYCCFPLVSRGGVNALGFCMPPEYPGWNADIVIWKIYAAVGRVLDLSGVLIEHISYHCGKRGRDDISLHVERISNQFAHIAPEVMQNYIGRLRGGISAGANKIKGNETMDNILQDATDLYSRVKRYHASIGHPDMKNFIWANNMSDIGNIVSSSRTAKELIDRVDQTFMYAINFPPENGENTGVWKYAGDRPHIREKCVDWLLAKQKVLGADVFEDDKWQESEHIHERNKVVRDGHTLSGNFLRTFSIYKQIKKHVGNFKSVLELGAGCGHQCRTVLLGEPDCKYTIIDLPETLLFSYTHLSLCFPEKKILYVSSPEDVAKIDEHDIVFVPDGMANVLDGKSYDLFINTASMGEMRNDVIYFWMHYIQHRVRIKNLFTLNRFLNVIDPGHQKMRMAENECTTSYDHLWDITQWELEPLYCRCPYMDTLHSRYVEIIAKRPTSLSPEQMFERSNQMLQEAMDEDWYRLKGYYGDGVMQQRANVLVNDTTMGGTIFKLWESIRLNQNARNVQAMLDYLPLLTVHHPFEELFYYQALRSRL